MKNLFLFILFVGFTTKGISQNYVKDSNFSNPSPAIWIKSNAGSSTGFNSGESKTQDNSGSYILNENFNAEIKQRIKAAETPSGVNDYTIKYWVKGKKGVKIQCIAFNGTGKKGQVYSIQNSDTWELVQEVFTFDADKSITLKLLLKKKNKSITLDDVSVELGNTTEK
ncbi:hypothetical protein [Wenyingzhuangia sp. IMCC45574]